MKKVLILTVTAGGGHNSAAAAMKDKLTEEGYGVKVVDMFWEFAPGRSCWVVDRGYAIAVSRFRRLYNAFYEHYRKRSESKALVGPEQRMVGKVYGGLLSLIYSYRPDVVYCTSFHCAVATSNLKRAYNIPARVVTAVFDYVLSPYWECAAYGLDKIAVPDRTFYDQLICKGFNMMQIAPVGIPVRQCDAVDKAEARRRLGFKDDRFTVLIMFGGGFWKGAYSAFGAILKGVKKQIRIIVVNGHDSKSKRKIDKRIRGLSPLTEVVNYGFTDCVPTLMQASDVMVGKGGGLSVTESIECRLPLIATSKLAAQEIYNVDYLLKRGAADVYKSRGELARLVNAYIEEPRLLESKRSALARLNGGGLNELAAIIRETPAADYARAEIPTDYSSVNRKVKAARLRAYREEKFLNKYEKYKNQTT